MNPHASHSTSLRGLALSLWYNRRLAARMARREIAAQYQGSVLGLFWYFFNPIFMLAVYTFVFSMAFKARWSTGDESKTDFALLLFIGLIIFNVLADCVSRAPMLIASHVSYVKKVIFPLEILPCVLLLTALFRGGCSLAVWLLAYTTLHGLPPATALCLPLVIFPLLLLVLGLCWILSSLGVYLRDMSQLVGIATTMFMFVSPVFYPITALPEHFRPLLYCNPLTLIIEQARAVLYWGQLPDFRALAVFWAITILLAWSGFVWFQKTRKGFADVL